MQELNKATRARVSNTMEGGKVGGKAFGGNLVSIISVGRNETFRLFFFIDRFVSLFLLNDSVSKDESMYFAVSKFFTGELTLVRIFGKKSKLNSR